MSSGGETLVTKGLVLSQTRHIEYNKIISVLTEDRGLISVYVYGGMSLRNRNFSGSLPYSFSELEISKKGDMYILKEASSIKYFYEAGGSLSRNALIMYISEVLSEVCVENEGDGSGELLHLALNILYSIYEGKKDLLLIKAVFELRLMLGLGQYPLLERECISCGRHSDEPPYYLDIREGGLICKECFDEKSDRSECVPVSGAAAEVLSYISSCDEKRILAFSLDPGEILDLSEAAEKYLLFQLGRGFSSLSFFKRVKDQI